MRGWFLLLGVSLAACQGPADPGQPDPPGSDPGFRVEPANVNLSGPLPSGPSTFQFRAISDQGQPVAVFWRLSNPNIGSIDAEGKFTPCYGGGQTTLRALLQTDTTKVASTMFWVAQAAFGLVSVKSLTRSPSGSPAPLDSLSGALETEVNIAAGALNCSTVLGARLELIAGSAVIEVGRANFIPAPTASLDYKFTWSTTGLSNGSYWLRAILVVNTGGTVSEFTSGPVSVTIRN